MHVRTIILVAAIALIWASQACAAQKASAADGPQPQSAAGGFDYVTGGIGQSEQAAMTRRYGDYALKLVTARRGERAAYVSGVDVTIRDGDDRVVLETTTKGPWLMVDLPPGRYTLAADHKGRTQTRKLDLSGHADKQIVLRWGR